MVVDNVHHHITVEATPPLHTNYPDQLNIPRGELDDENILIRLRQLRSGFNYFTSVGLSYTFGSIFNNVVNPRFGRGERNFSFRF